MRFVPKLPKAPRAPGSKTIKSTSKAKGGRGGGGGGGRMRTGRNDSMCAVMVCLWRYLCVCVVYRESALVAATIFSDRSDGAGGRFSRSDTVR